MWRAKQISTSFAVHHFHILHSRVPDYYIVNTGYGNRHHVCFTDHKYDHLLNKTVSITFTIVLCWRELTVHTVQRQIDRCSQMPLLQDVSSKAPVGFSGPDPAIT